MQLNFVSSVAKPELFNFGSGSTLFLILAPAPTPDPAKFNTFKKYKQSCFFKYKFKLKYFIVPTIMNS